MEPRISSGNMKKQHVAQDPDEPPFAEQENYAKTQPGLKHEAKIQNLNWIPMQSSCDSMLVVLIC